MQTLLQEKYINKLFLPHIKKKHAGYNFECPFCHEGNSQGRKTRAWLLSNRDYSFFCHNCSRSFTFKYFLKMLDTSLYDQYNFELKRDALNLLTTKPIKSEIPTFDLKKIKYQQAFNPKYMHSIERHQKAMKYCKKRKIPEKYYKELFFSVNNDKYKDMIIFPFLHPDRGIYGFQGRSIKEKRFRIYSPENNPKIWNLFKVDLSRDVYITESIIDSMFLDNSIAMVGASMPETILKEIPKPVFVFDLDVTGIRKSYKYAKRGYNIFVWSVDMCRKNVKDINDLVVNENFSLQKVNYMVKGNVFKDRNAELKLGILHSQKKFKGKIYDK